ncbi:MAG: hypothetical protein AABZ84_04920 [Pseudomonadota bacterium]
MRITLLIRLCALMLCCGGLAAMAPAQAACTGGACLSAGPRLASVDSTRGALLNALLGNLLGSSVNLSVADWNNLAQGDVNLVSYLNALQTSLNVSSPAAALSADATLAQLISTMAAAAQADGDTATAAALANLQPQVSALAATVRLGDLLTVTTPSGALSDVNLNALDLVTGGIQLYNYDNVLTTPTPVTISGGAIGLAGVINSVQLYAQVIEPPVMICGPAGTQFHTAAIRVKLNLDLVDLGLGTSALTLLPGVTSAALTLAQLELYVEVARAQGTLATVNALADAVIVQATPGVADLYLGSISDANFFNRSRVLNTATDLGFSTIGALTINALTVNLQVKSAARGEAPFSSSLSFSGPYPQTRSASTSAAFIANLAGTLVNNLSVSVSPSLGLLDAVVLPAVKTLVGTALTPVLTTLLTGLVDPLLELLGIRLGEVDVTVYGVTRSCSIAGTVYLDANHNATLDGEAGTGLTLYAKAIASSSPGGPALLAATVDPASGAYSLAGIGGGSYTVIVDTNNTLSDVAPTAPAGWVGTESPSLARVNTTLTFNDVGAQNFGLYHGSKLSGRVFKDNGAGGGTPNNAVQDGGETGLANVVIKITDNGGGVIHDSTASGGDGNYTLWIPAAADASIVKVVEINAGGYISVGGAAGNTGGGYDRAGDTLSFTNAAGGSYTGVNFADVPDLRFLTDGRQTAVPGGVVFYPHQFVAGSGGQLTFSAAGTANPNEAGWNQVLYLDGNCSGALDSGELPIAAVLNVGADQQVCIVVKVGVPVNAAYNAQYPLTVSASFTYINASPALTGTQSHSDLTTVSNPAEAGLKLTKTVDKNVAQSGEVITYTVSYINNSSAALSNLKINDSTPAYTVFNAASCGALPAGLTVCTLTAQPAAGAAGAIEWTFTGTLISGGSGNVGFSVILE